MIHSLLRNKDTMSSHLINAYFQDTFLSKYYSHSQTETEAEERITTFCSISEVIVGAIAKYLKQLK